MADTAMSDVDGERGRLALRGHDVERLAPVATLEDVVGLLWDGTLPDDDARRLLRRDLARARVDEFERLSGAGDSLSMTDGMEALRAGIAHVRSSNDARRDALALVGAAPVIIAAWWRHRRGLAPVAPDASLSHAADYLAMLQGEAPDPRRVRALDTYLVTVSDHGMNASTFTARVVASTGSDSVSAITAAIGALKGPLHGGAPGPVLDMLDAIATPERAEAWVGAELAAGSRIMGLGHRVYRVRDPRAAVLEHELERLATDGLSSGRLPLARAVETVAVSALAAKHPARALQANVEFYTAVLLDTIGLDRAIFSPTFAVGRVVGWLAHVAEQRATGRLIRPASRYVGPPVK